MKIKFILLSALSIFPFIFTHEISQDNQIQLSENFLSVSNFQKDNSESLTNILETLSYEQKIMYALAINRYYSKNHPGYVGGFEDYIRNPNDKLISNFIKMCLENDPSLNNIEKMEIILKEYNLNNEKFQINVYLAEKRKLSDVLNTLTKEMKYKYAHAIDLDYAHNHPGYIGGFDDSPDEVSEEKVILYIQTFLQSEPIYDDLDLLDELVKKFDL